MHKIIFNEISTSSLGFGCSSLTKHFSSKKAVNILHSAFECGITHFDTARAYGFGLAESLVGKFAKGKRSEITIATKFGLAPANFLTRNLFLLNSARSLINTVSGLKGKVVKGTGGANKRELISAQNAEQSLNTSLQALGTDYVDFFLLHECFLAETNQDEILKFMDKAKASGKVRYVGIAGNNIPIESFAGLDERYSILQYPASFAKDRISQLGALEQLHIHYNLFSKREAGQPFNLDLLLQQAAASNRNGICLFTSTNHQHIRSTAKAWNDIKLT
jgi:aryl-alcohol dehydrogenase-like predicted oxidoreductase